SGCSPTRGIPGGMSTGSSGVLPGTAPIELVLDVPREHAPTGCSAPALRLRCLCAYVGERVLANPGYSREGRVLVRPACCRGLRPSSWCSTFPGNVLLRGVAHLRYACVVCAHTSASGCSPTRVSPGGTSTSSSGGAGPRVNPQPWPASGGRLHLDHPRLWCVVLDRFNALVPGGSGLILLAGAYHLMVGRLEIEHELA